MEVKVSQSQVEEQYILQLTEVSQVDKTSVARCL